MKRLSRRNFLLSSTLPLFPYIYKSTNKRNATNILLIISDDLNNYTSYLNCPTELLTPNIHSLQKQSITFENAYCQYPLCHPSRTSMLTGLHPFSTSVYMSEQINPAEFPILPQYLKERHYFTAGIGKVFHPKYNIESVWDFNIELYDNLYNFINKKDDPLSQQNFCYGPVDISIEETHDYKITQQACDFIKSQKNNPWFLAVGLHTPHTPLFAPQEFFKKIPKNIVKKPITPDDDLNDIPEAGIKLVNKYDNTDIHQLVLERNIWEEVIHAYLVRIAFLDELIGNILKNLEEHGMLNNTCIFLCGDNGWHLGEKKRWQKFTLWQEAVKVPLIAHLPDGYKGGLTIKEPAGLIDIFPTITDILSMDKPEKLEGKSLLPLIEKQIENQYAVISQIENNNFAFRTKRYSYIVYYDGSEELYDYQSDPGEWHNIAHLEESQKIKRNIILTIPENQRAKLASIINKDIFHP